MSLDIPSRYGARENLSVPSGVLYDELLVGFGQYAVSVVHIDDGFLLALGREADKRLLWQLYYDWV